MGQADEPRNPRKATSASRSTSSSASAKKAPKRTSAPAKAATRKKAAPAAEPKRPRAAKAEAPAVKPKRKVLKAKTEEAAPRAVKRKAAPEPEPAAPRKKRPAAEAPPPAQAALPLHPPAPRPVAAAPPPPPPPSPAPPPARAASEPPPSASGPGAQGRVLHRERWESRAERRNRWEAHPVGDAPPAPRLDEGLQRDARPVDEGGEGGRRRRRRRRRRGGGLGAEAGGPAPVAAPVHAPRPPRVEPPPNGAERREAPAVGEPRAGGGGDWQQGEREGGRRKRRRRRRGGGGGDFVAQQPAQAPKPDWTPAPSSAPPRNSEPWDDDRRGRRRRRRRGGGGSAGGSGGGGGSFSGGGGVGSFGQPANWDMETPPRGAVALNMLPDRDPFTDLVSIDPDERIDLETDAEEVSMRVLDIVTPLGKGQRGLIVAPPKTGKTTLLMQLARAISENHPEIELIVMLVDERPEEVTAFRRAGYGTVMASSNDESTQRHLKLTQYVLDHAKKRVLEGKDVCILLDSITRMARAHNVAASGHRTLSGGLDSRALERPKRFFGAARNIVNGGSLTILATALIDTGSRMDEVIFQEFKGTGNSELQLDRRLAERRIWPAIDIQRSGTRKEEKLFERDEYEGIVALRRALSGKPPAEAMTMLLNRLKEYRTNREFLRDVARKAATIG